MPGFPEQSSVSGFLYALSAASLEELDLVSQECRRLFGTSAYETVVDLDIDATVFTVYGATYQAVQTPAHLVYAKHRGVAFRRLMLSPAGMGELGIRGIVCRLMPIFAKFAQTGEKIRLGMPAIHQFTEKAAAARVVSKFFLKS